MATIDQLDETYPDGSVHKVYVLDDDLRALKRTLKDTFQNLTAAVTVTHTELNYLDGLINNVQAQIDTLGAQRQSLLSRGAVYAGKIALDGTGDILPDGWSSARDSLGNYTITLASAKTVYAANFNIDAGSTTDYWRYTISVGGVSTTEVPVKVVDANSGSAVDAGFYFHIHANS